MKMERHESNIHYKESNTRAVGYADEFREFLREHKEEHLLKRFLELKESLKKEGDVEEVDGLRVTLFLRQEDYLGISQYYKVEFENRIFFVKWWDRKLMKNMPGWHTLESETNTAVRAKELLKDIPGVGVIPFEFGGETKEGTYFVSRWVDGKLLSTMSETDFEHLKKRYYEAAEILEENHFKDVRHYNTMYVKNEDVLYFFDIHQTTRD